MERFFLTVVAVVAMSALSPVKAAQEPALAENMAAMQYFLHKLSLSIAARNTELADFYAHELEETIEDAEKIKEYKGHRIGQMVKSMLVPPFEALEDAIDEGNWAETDARLADVIMSCNACHQQSQFGFIRIQPTTQNPFMQLFEPSTR